MSPIKLQPKEVKFSLFFKRSVDLILLLFDILFQGIALINGTQLITALGAEG